MAVKPRELVLAQLEHHATQPVPYTLRFEDEVGEALDVHYGGVEWRQRLTPYIVRVPGVDAIRWEPIDEVHSRDGYGGIWRLDRRPWHLEEPPMKEPSFAHYVFPSAESFFRAEDKEEARRLCEEHRDSFLVANLGWGLFETSWILRGFENVLLDAVAEPEFFAELLDRIMDLKLACLDYVADLPVDGIMFADDWADQRGVIIGPERWRKFLKPRWARIYQAAHAQGKFVLSHCCGSVVDIMPDIIEIGLDVLESVQPEARGMNPYELKKRWGSEITFWGGLGSQSIIPFGTPQAIRDEVRRLRSKMSRDGGYILAPAKPLMPETPIENAVAIVEAFTEQG